MSASWPCWARWAWPGLGKGEWSTAHAEARAEGVPAGCSEEFRDLPGQGQDDKAAHLQEVPEAEVSKVRKASKN